MKNDRHILVRRKHVLCGGLHEKKAEQNEQECRGAVKDMACKRPVRSKYDAEGYIHQRRFGLTAYHRAPSVMRPKPACRLIRLQPKGLRRQRPAHEARCEIGSRLFRRSVVADLSG